ncbi:MAG: trehalose-phosphatase [Thermodesulfobacteriota bacterium]
MDDFNAIEEFKERVGGVALSLFLDYDGTLAPIVGRPEDAALSYSMKEVLRRLQRRYPMAIISGRSLDDIMSRVAIKGVVYAGNHGFEIESEAFSYRMEEAQEFKDRLPAIAAKLHSCLSGFKGVIVEDKGLTLSVHYRLVDIREAPGVIEAVNGALASFKAEGRVRVTRGKKVIEVRPPVKWGKGKAVTWILARGPFVETIPVYIGDDETDRAAFRAIKGRGLSIVVGHRWKEADYFLRDQSEVIALLKWLSTC